MASSQAVNAHVRDTVKWSGYVGGAAVGHLLISCVHEAWSIKNLDRWSKYV